jgi:transcriptional regulator with XRE-family HTH domain
MSKAKKGPPIAVTNLRKIWEQKKRQLELTQVEAADKLGWTQGAFSQYLNGITELGPAATIKLANFLGVDPEEIDPAIHDDLPGIHRVPVRYDMNSTKAVNNRYTHVSFTDDLFRVQIKPEFCTDSIRKRFPYLAKAGCQLVCADPNKTYRPRSTENEPLYLICRKGESSFDIAEESQLPPAKKLAKKFTIVGLAYY